jgi:tetratricopeptide (TPR) repeat protein/CHAT domain-containing protein
MGAVMLASWRSSHGAVLILLLMFLVGISSTFVNAQDADNRDIARRQVEQLDRAGKHLEALALQRRLATQIEKAEIASTGRPGAKTVGALVDVARYALLARDFRTALAASSRAHALAPLDLSVETNRAHALLFLGRVGEARALYRAYKGKPISLTGNRLWEDVVADDIELLQKRGLDHRAFGQIEAELRGKSTAATADLAELNRTVQELDREGNYKEAETAAQRYVALARQRYSEDRPQFAIALSWLGRALLNQGRYAEAESLYERALAIDEKALGPDHLTVGTDLNNLAVLYDDQGRHAEAEPLYKRALAIAEKALGSDHPDVAIRLNNLAGLYRTEGRSAEAEPLYKRALAIGEKALGPDHPTVGTDLNNLAVLYDDQGRYAEAEPAHKRALAIAEKALGPDHPDVAIRLNNLAQLYRTEGRYAEAEPLYKRALAIGEKALGPDHPTIGTDLNNLAVLYDDQGRYADAEPLYKRALAIAEKALGPNHPDVGSRLNNLAFLYRDQGRYAEAEPLFKRALAIGEKALGPDHPDVAIRLNNLADLYQAQGGYAEAEPLYKRALAIDERALGPDHPAVGTRLNNLAKLYDDQARYAEAEPLYKRALAIAEKALGPDHPAVGIPLNNLAWHYEVQGRYDEAEPLLKRSLAITEETFGPDHPDVAARLNNLAALYQAQGRYADAEPLYKRALAITEKALGLDHPNVGKTLNNLAELYRAQGRYAEAEPLYKRALAIAEKALGSDHPDVAARLNNLAGLYYGQSDWVRAADYWRRSTSVILRRAQRGTLVGEALTGKRKSEAEQNSWQFSGLVKAVYRLASKQRDEKGLPREMFQTAQWAQISEAAESLAQMAARGAKDDSKLAAMVRERQDLVAEWQTRDQVRSAAVAQAPEKRNREAEAANIARLTAIDVRIVVIDQELAAKFPEYAALASPAPLSVEDVQKQLGADEALVLFLDTSEANPTPEETFIWVVTRTDMRWVRSELGTPALTREVAALRCGLDYQGAWTDSHCSELLNSAYTRADHDVFGKPLPFDLARANKLYKALFGQIEDSIKDKRLLIVPSGPLTRLPFQILVQSLPSDVSAVERSREIARLGAELTDPTDDDRKRLQLKEAGGVRIVRVVPGSAAEAAGLKQDDIVLLLDGVEFSSYQKVSEAIKAHAPGDKVQINILRDGTERAFAATLGAFTIHEWIPRFLANGEGKSIAWLARDHAITVLPAVSSLKALRELAKESHASEPYIGFGNPLLDGSPDKYPEDVERAKLAREKRCTLTLRRAASLSRGATRGIDRDASGLIMNVAAVDRQAPLPETADELCEVANDLGADPATNVLIGATATETKVKELSADGALAKYRIVHFATHGALAGQLSRDAEPGLILTPPANASETDDGYLTASEIAGLKLDADWVILSACNTAGGEVQGAEALSGLARAFFFAGARSLLVSHWEVNSDAAVKLITKAVAELKTDPKIGRAEALRRSMLSMIDTDKDYEAHPAFWAPFVLVGEGGAAR